MSSTSQSSAGSKPKRSNEAMCFVTMAEPFIRLGIPAGAALRSIRVPLFLLHHPPEDHERRLAALFLMTTLVFVRLADLGDYPVIDH